MIPFWKHIPMSIQYTLPSTPSKREAKLYCSRILHKLLTFLIDHCLMSVMRSVHLAIGSHCDWSTCQQSQFTAHCAYNKAIKTYYIGFTVNLTTMFLIGQC